MNRRAQNETDRFLRRELFGEEEKKEESKTQPRVEIPGHINPLVSPRATGEQDDANEPAPFDMTRRTNRYVLPHPRQKEPEVVEEEDKEYEEFAK